MQHSGCRYQTVTKFSPTDKHSLLKSHSFLSERKERQSQPLAFSYRTRPPSLSRITLGGKGKDTEKFHIYNNMQTPRAEKAQKLQAFSALAEN